VEPASSDPALHGHRSLFHPFPETCSFSSLLSGEPNGDRLFLVLVCPAAVITKAPRVADKQVIVGAAGDDAGERFCRPGIS
jgi:hypothetical protein